MITIARPAQPLGFGSVRVDWVREYRRSHPLADHWAAGVRRVGHSLETQERVFRMAEQLARRGVDRATVFAALEVAGASLSPSLAPRDAADAGYRAIARLIAIAPECVVICSEQGVANVAAFGFDPIPFDGHDPAAYAWAIYELSSRSDADHQRLRRQCRCHPAMASTPIGLARL